MRVYLNGNTKDITTLWKPQRFGGLGLSNKRVIENIIKNKISGLRIAKKKKRGKSKESKQAEQAKQANIFLNTLKIEDDDLDLRQNGWVHQLLCSFKHMGDIGQALSTISLGFMGINVILLTHDRWLAYFCKFIKFKKGISESAYINIPFIWANNNNTGQTKIYIQIPRSEKTTSNTENQMDPERQVLWGELVLDSWRENENSEAGSKSGGGSRKRKKRNKKTKKKKKRKNKKTKRKKRRKNKKRKTKKRR